MIVTSSTRLADLSVLHCSQHFDPLNGKPQWVVRPDLCLEGYGEGIDGRMSKANFATYSDDLTISS